MFYDFHISTKYQDSTTEKFFEHGRRYQLFGMHQISKEKQLQFLVLTTVSRQFLYSTSLFEQHIFKVRFYIHCNFNDKVLTRPAVLRLFLVVEHESFRISKKHKQNLKHIIFMRTMNSNHL